MPENIDYGIIETQVVRKEEGIASMETILYVLYGAVEGSYVKLRSYQPTEQEKTDSLMFASKLEEIKRRVIPLITIQDVETAVSEKPLPSPFDRLGNEMEKAFEKTEKEPRQALPSVDPSP
jgi:hypothetical protein